MIGDTVTRTLCGLWVVEGGDLLNTSNFSWTTQVIDEPGDAENIVAEEFARQELLAQVGRELLTDQWVIPTDVFFGPQHEGEVPREAYWLTDFNTDDILSLSDPEVPAYLVGRESMVGPDEMRSYTVCGRGLNSGNIVCWSTLASNPLMAYFNTWQEIKRQSGDHMLLCAVHPGQVDLV